MPKLVLWDWNGTLLDDVDFSVECLNMLLEKFGYTQRYDFNGYQEIFGFPIEEYYLRAGFDFDAHPFSLLAEHFMDYYIPKSVACPAMRGARETLTTLQNMGLKQVILSASPLTTLTKQVAERGLTNFFDELLGLDDIYAKSKVALGTQWMASSGITPEDAVMIGDSTHDAQVAAAMGVRCILYAGGHQNTATLSATGCTVIQNLTELPALLK